MQHLKKTHKKVIRNAEHTKTEYKTAGAPPALFVLFPDNHPDTIV